MVLTFFVWQEAACSTANTLAAGEGQVACSTAESLAAGEGQVLVPCQPKTLCVHLLMHCIVSIHLSHSMQL